MTTHSLPLGAARGSQERLRSFEFYPTPDPFARWLFDEMQISGRCAELGVGDGAIIRAANTGARPHDLTWVTNDLDPLWPADFHMDATTPELYDAIGPVDWHVGNPAFTIAEDSICRQIAHARVGVAMHLRASIHEVLKARVGGKRKGPRVPFWLAEQPPTGILWLPRFAYQRSKTTGKWTTDSVCACWCIWLKDPAAPQFIRYAPESVLDDLDAFTPAYRRRMDELMRAEAA